MLDWLVASLAPAPLRDAAWGLARAVGFAPALLDSDALLWLVAIGSLLWGWSASRDAVWRAAFAQVARSRLAVLSACVLLAFSLLALADSFRWRRVDPNGQPGPRVTLLDLMGSPLAAGQEKTFSAPLATRLFLPETVRDGGVKSQQRLRLRFGGSHLKEESAWLADVAALSALGLLAGGAAGLALAVPLLARQGAGVNSPALGVVVAFLGGLGALVGVAAALSTGYHVLGTDQAGQSVLLTALKSVRTSMVIGTLTTLIILPLAVGAGLAAGFLGGWVDDVVQYLYTTLGSIPDVLLIAAAVLALNAQLLEHGQGDAMVASDVRLLALCGIIGLTGWAGLCQMIRAEALRLRQAEHVQAAQAFGLSPVQVMLRHLLPNVAHLALISIVLRFSELILVEAVLAYVQVGVGDGVKSFGNVVAGSLADLTREPAVWWSLLTAFSFMLLLVLPANLFGDVLRDALDPRLRDQRG